jgi:hypothetical protein
MTDMERGIIRLAADLGASVEDTREVLADNGVITVSPELIKPRELLRKESLGAPSGALATWNAMQQENDND